MMSRIATLLLATFAIVLAGCPSNQPAQPNGGGGGGGGGGSQPIDDSPKPVFSLAWSEYPSWSVFGVAHARKLINGDEGELSELEMKWGVDIVLKQLDYDPCIVQFGSNAIDAVCITNMDVLSPSLGRPAVAILPTSTSNGADALIANADIKTVDDLKGQKVYGLENSVSEYCFVRNLELLGKKELENVFEQKDPAEAALAMQTNPQQTKAIMVWNPFVLQTLKVPGTHRLFDSSSIPGEIVDMIVVGKDALERPGGENFACAVIDTFYRVSDMIEAPATREQTLEDLARKFADLSAQEMETVVKETAFYKTPDDGIGVFTGTEFPETMKKVVAFCVEHGLVKEPPKIAYGHEGTAQLKFDPSYIERVKQKQ